jgi:GT2 family glycosyltransferase
MLKLSLVTGKIERDASFQRLVDSIFACTSVKHELIVADASAVPYQPQAANIRVLPEPKRMGCTAAYNRAFQAARGEFVIWLNDDCEVLRGYDTAAISFMESNPQIGLGALYYKEGSKDFHVNAYFGMVYANFGILRRELGEQIGWFDDEIPMYGNDNSLAFRVLQSGHGIAAIPGARVIHYAIQDRYREEHGETAQRILDVERLTAKYGPHIAAMRETYIRTGSTPLDGIHDQTPGFIREKVSG